MKQKKEGSSGSTDTELKKELAEIKRRLERSNRDLEAYAKEAQIELAMERIRARAIAMQKSEELREVIHLIFEQLIQLNFNVNSASFALDYKESDDFNLWLSSEGQSYPAKVHIPYLDIPIFNRFIEAKKTGVDFLTENYSIEEKNAFFDHFFKNVQGVKDERKAFVMGAAGYARSTVLMKNVTLSMQNYAGIPYSEEENGVLRRFGKVFEQTYTRFLDLQQAEAQAREAQIELALERVRARTMAMQHSDELVDAAAILFKQVKELSVKVWTCGFQIWKAGEPGTTVAYMTLPDGTIRVPFDIPHIPEPFLNRAYEAAERGDQFYVEEIGGDALVAHYKYMLSLPGSSDRMIDISAGGFDLPEFQVNHNVFFPNGSLLFITYGPVPESWDIFRRFGKVFEQTYTRFLDLKKAEIQSRETQIELALERVRARTMAMQHSDELAETAYILFQQFRELGENPDQATIGIINEAEGVIEYWVTMYGNQSNRVYKFSITEPNVTNRIFKAWQAHEKSLVIDLSGKELFDFSNYRQSMGGAAYNPEEKQRIINVAFFSKGIINVQSTVSRSVESIRLLERFANVFEGTYTRFLDLKNAEAQAREAQIELSLERVRAKTMAMHDSRDIDEVVIMLFDELLKLGAEKTIRCGVNIFNDARQGEIWSASFLQNGETTLTKGFIDMGMHPLLVNVYNAWENKAPNSSYELAGTDLEKYYEALIASPNYPFAHKIAELPKKQVNNAFFFPEGCLFAFTAGPLSADASRLFTRFARVFGLTYRRFLDLQRAEAQAREAQIEASLERVRSKAMAMRNSNDLSDAASIVFTELRNLGISPIRSGVGLINSETLRARIYSNTSTQTAADLALMGEVPLVGHPIFEQQYRSWLKQENYFVALSGKELASYYKILSAGLNADLGINIQKEQLEYGHWFMFSDGFLYIWSDKEYNDAEIKLLERFKNVIELTFRRYIELQKTEAQAKEAIKQASLDRVRGEIASMRTTTDLERITPLIWNELTILGLPFIRCGVFIMDEQQQQINSYLSTPAGKAIAAFQIPFEAEGIGSVVLENWRSKQAIAIHWTEEEFRNFSHSLAERGKITSEDGYLIESLPTGLDLHFFPFLQGMLYAGNTEPLSEDEKHLVQSLANAFSTAYARYEDFNRLEIAKKEVERTLTDLKAAQTRLIQSEKMASLGELTAGIAHEIQNPLNFVNNFSEVNMEMLEELKAESEKPNGQRDDQLEIELINDIIQNEQKINHHGKRADGIVKGMLQHSRTAGGEKLPTNINALVEEFMRLSYHGLRAKDKNFNAQMLTNFDPDLPKIQAVGQDIGRVFLNLFNNAFYAVKQKKKTSVPAYNPEISVTTSINNGQVIIKVKDNGVGMPEHVKDKIMQPFFTTKPTGEGTGLGLSLTYDMVVKGHGGSIQVNSIEGEGSEFIITLPIV